MLEYKKTDYPMTARRLDGSQNYNQGAGRVNGTTGP
jgi:hypothetical protein